MKIKFVLGKTLDFLEIKPNKLAQESKIRSATIYEMVAGKPLAIKFETLTSILDTLNSFAIEKGLEQRFDISDVFIYEYGEDQK